MSELILWISLVAAIPFVLGILVEAGRPRAGTDTGPGRQVGLHGPHPARAPRTLRSREVTTRRGGRARVVGRAHSLS